MKPKRKVAKGRTIQIESGFKTFAPYVLSVEPVGARVWPPVSP
jgi:hypothetical protein